MCAAPARHRLAPSAASHGTQQFWLAKDLLIEGGPGASARHARRATLNHARSATSNHALQIGRVGALAVSLGVGFAIANSAQPAYADTGTTSSNESTSSSGSSDTSDSDSGSSPTAGPRNPSAASDGSPGSHPAATRKRAPKTAATPKTATKRSEEVAAEEPSDVPTDIAEFADTPAETVAGSGRKTRAHIQIDKPLQVEKAVTAVVQASPEPAVEPVAQVVTDAEEAPAASPVTAEVPQTPAVHDTKPAVGTITPKMTAASATAGTTSATTPNPLDVIVNTMMAWVARQISHTFVNRTPVAGPIGYEQNVLGQVYVDLNATDPNGDVLTYDIIQPEKGWVYRDLISGKFVYTSWALVTGQPLVDSFKIVIHDDSEHLPGVLGQIQTLVETVTRFLGIAQADNLTVSIPVTVDPVYQAPPLVTPIIGGGYTIGKEPAHIVSTVDIVDGDSLGLKRVVIKVATLAQVGDVLTYNGPADSPIIGSWDPETLTLTLSGSGTLAQYEEAIKAVTFSATQGAALVRGLSISATDEHGVSNVAPGFVTVGVSSPTRYVPLVTPIGGRSYTIGNSAVRPVAAVDIVDADSSHLQRVTMRVTTFGKDGDTLSFNGLPDNPVTAVYDSVTRTLTLSGVATKAQYEDALKAVAFTATEGGWTTRTILIVATDTDGVKSSAGSLTLSVW